jgi:hypothetical protein
MMAAYGTDPARYLPPHISQLATKLSRDGVDDCLVCSILALVNGASLDEATERQLATSRRARSSCERPCGCATSSTTRTLPPGTSKTVPCQPLPRAGCWH